MWHWSCMCVYMHVCTSVVSVCTHVCTSACVHAYVHESVVCVHACVHKRACVHVYVCACSERLGEVARPWEALCMAGRAGPPHGTL